MLRAVLLLGLVGIFVGQPGGWTDYHGKVPDVVLNAVRMTLSSVENIIVVHMELSNVRTQVCGAIYFIRML